MNQDELLDEGEPNFNFSKDEIRIEEADELDIDLEREAKQEPENAFKCENCSEIFETKRNLNKHIARAHRDRFSCDLCGKTLSGDLELKKHLAEHYGECDVCNKTFKDKQALRRHKTYAHAAARHHRCKVCSKNFAVASLLKTHLKKHDEERPYKCEQCSETFETEKSLKNHIVRMHLKGGKLACGFCGKFFTSIAQLNDHLPEHSEKKKQQLVCDQCGTCFKAEQDLVSHKTHVHSVASFRCIMCSKKFPTLHCVQEHILEHCKEEPFSCDQCCARFSEESHLEQHATLRHSTKSLACDQCGRTYKTQRGLSQHTLTEHGEGSKVCYCDVCDKPFKFPSLLKLHLASHSDERSFECDQCDKTFKIKGNLTSHKSHAHATEAPFQSEQSFKVEGHDNDRRFLSEQTLTNPVKHEVDVKEEPVVLYDPEVMQEFSDEIKVEMEVKQEPEVFDET